MCKERVIFIFSRKYLLKKSKNFSEKYYHLNSSRYFDDAKKLSLKWYFRRFNTCWYGTLTGSAIISITVSSFLVNIPQRTLPFKAWLPYGYDSFEIGFWFAYFHQRIAHAVAATVNIAFDTLFPGFLMQTCTQIKILKFRLDRLPKTIDDRMNTDVQVDDERYQKESQFQESKSLNECIRHHLKISQ